MLRATGIPAGLDCGTLGALQTFPCHPGICHSPGHALLAPVNRRAWSRVLTKVCASSLTHGGLRGWHGRTPTSIQALLCSLRPHPCTCARGGSSAQLALCFRSVCSGWRVLTPAGCHSSPGPLAVNLHSPCSKLKIDRAVISGGVNEGPRPAGRAGRASMNRSFLCKPVALCAPRQRKKYNEIKLKNKKQKNGRLATPQLDTSSLLTRNVRKPVSPRARCDTCVLLPPVSVPVKYVWGLQ